MRKLFILLVLILPLACGPAGGGETELATARPAPAGRCGDGVCDGPENAELCPQDCAPTEAPPPPSPVPAKERCGDGTCSASEFERCPQDCVVEASSDLPLYVIIYYHIEPNPQLFESVEPGYFEAVSLSIREMSSSLAEIDVHATFCFAWLYNDLVYCRNRAQSGEVVNNPQDTGIETFEQVVADGHEVAYHTHPPAAIQEGDQVYYARPDAACQRYDTSNRHRWTGPSPDERLIFYPGVYRFDDPADPWYGQFTWERTSESLFLIADYVGAPVRHANGGQRPLLDVANRFGAGVNHEDGIAQIRSLMNVGFDLLSPEIMPYFHTGHAPEGTEWTDFSTAHAAYFDPQNNVQMYYPDIDGGHLEWAVSAR